LITVVLCWLRPDILQGALKRKQTSHLPWQVMYHARIYPEVRACNLAPQQLCDLHEAIKMVLEVSIAVDSDSARLPKTWLFHYR
jgi:hypothetical protein